MNKDEFNFEKELVKAAFLKAALFDYNWTNNGPVVELPCEVALSTIFDINREFTYDLYRDEMQPVSYVIYPLSNQWVIQTIHGFGMPNEWAKEARPRGLVNLYLDYKSKYKLLDKAIFSNREDCLEALDELLNKIYWDHNSKSNTVFTTLRCENGNYHRYYYTYDRDPYGFFNWDSFGKKEYEDSRIL